MGGRTLGSIASVATRAVDVDRAHVRVGQCEHERKLLAQVMGCLTRRPTGELATLERGDCARWTDGAVRVNGEVISGRQSPIRGRERRVAIDSFACRAFPDD